MIYDELREHETKLAVVGLGYVGLPLAVAFDEEAWTLLATTEVRDG